jgi:metacaspase-1
VPRGESIHVGLNGVDPTHYQGWDGKLVACEFDANDMADLAARQGFQTHKLLTREATAEAVIGAIRVASAELESGDILFLSYSGHGGQIEDSNSDELDRKDETWCLFDRELVDDELYTLWSAFNPGVRVLVLSDSCHSGSAARSTLEVVGIEPIAAAVGADGEDGGPPRLKVLPERLQRDVYQQHKDLYDDIQKKATAYDKTELQVPVLLISGCQDSQTSADGDRNGLFTQALRKVWADGAFDGNYRRFWKKIVAEMPLWQVPNFFWAGLPSTEFEHQPPFTV